jgi:hypothetical protein
MVGDDFEVATTSAQACGVQGLEPAEQTPFHEQHRLERSVTTSG